jgi:hypothetical protein
MHSDTMVGQSGMGDLREVALRHMTSGAVVNRSALLFRKPAACIGMAGKTLGTKEGRAGGGWNGHMRVVAGDAGKLSIAGVKTAAQLHRGAVGQ